MSTKVPFTCRISKRAAATLKQRATDRRQRPATYGGALLEAAALESEAAASKAEDPEVTYEILWRVELAAVLLQRLAGKYPEVVASLKSEAQQTSRQILGLSPVSAPAQAPPDEEPKEPTDPGSGPNRALISRVTGRRR